MSTQKSHVLKIKTWEMVSRLTATKSPPCLMFSYSANGNYRS